MKTKKWGVALLAVIVLGMIALAAWKIFFSAPKTPEKLEGLLQAAFTLPDQELASGQPRPEGGDRLNDRIVEIVAPYCSEEKGQSIGIKYGVSKIPMLFLTSSWDAPLGPSMQVKNCTITPQKGKENSYDWAVAVTYGPNGTGTEMQFTGSARCDAEGKVEYWALSGPSELAAQQLYQELHSEP